MGDRIAVMRAGKILQLGGALIKVSTRPDVAVEADEDVGLLFEHAHISWLDAETERTIGV